MRAHRMGCGMALVVALGCGGGTSASVDGGRGPLDAGPRPDGGMLEDSAIGLLDGGPLGDGGLLGDSGPLVDGGGMPEVCTGGVDDDGDRQIDCEDDACWTFDACVLADVQEKVEGVVPCGAPIELDAAATAAACAALGTPSMSSETTNCDVGRLEVTARLFCDADGAPAALWIDERLETPATMRMISDRRFELTYYERATVIDWERRQSSGVGSEGSTESPIHDGRTPGGAAMRVITVRAVLPSDTVSRLLGLQFISTTFDRDLPMPEETRRSLRAGGLRIVVPAR